MNRFLAFLVILLIHTLSFAAPVADSQTVREEYEEFRQQDGATDHQPIAGETDMSEIFLVYGQKALEEGDAETALNHLRAGKELAPDDGRVSMMLGSGIMESACKQLAGQRRKGSGRRWSEAGALAMTALIAQRIDRSWEAFWASRPIHRAA